MTIYELKQETEAFKLGYWDAIQGADFKRNFIGSRRIDYLRGHQAGRDDEYRAAGGRKP